MNDKSSSSNNNHSESNERRYPLNNHDNVNIANEPIIRRRVVRRNQQHPYGLRANYSKDITSQNGEDGIIERIFQLIHNPTLATVDNDEEQQQPTLQEKDEDTEGHQQKRLWCVDVGAWDGIHLSNTRQLLLQRNLWNGVLIEADVTKFQSLQLLYNNDNNNDTNSTTADNNKAKDESSNDNDTANQQLNQQHDQLQQIVHCINATVSAMDDSDNTLTNILNRSNNDNNNTARIPYDIDFLCIDVDGIDYWILHNILSCNTYRPNCICIEFNPTMPYDLIYIPPKNDTVRHGCSLPALVELCEQYDYILIEITLYNAFFVPKQTIYDKCLKSHLPPYDPLDPIGSIVGAGMTSTMMQQPSMTTVLYQLYDGTLKLWGCKKLLWHRIPMEEEKLQMIPKQKRSFPFAPSSSSNHQDFRQCDSTNNHTTTTSFDYSQVVDVSSYLCNEKDCNDDMLKQQEHCSNLLVQKLQQNNGFCFVTMNGVSTAGNDNDSILSTELCQQGLYWTNQFLQVSDETVRRSCLSSVDRAKRGYSPINTENFGSLLGRSDISNDLVRKFRIGSKTKYTHTDDNNNRSIPKDEITEKEKRNAKSNSLLQPNIWPSKDVWDDISVQLFRSTLEEYIEKASIVAQHVVRAICDGLLRNYPDLKDSLIIFSQQQQENHYCNNESSPTCATTETATDEDNAAEADDSNQNEVAHDDGCNGGSTGSSSSSSSTILTILGYRPNSTRHKGKQKGRPLVAAHTDVGIITMLLFDDGDCAMLQRRKYDDDAARWSNKSSDSTNCQYKSNDGAQQWVDVTLPHLTSNNDPIFVINIADCLSDITGGILPSALHRVIPRPGVVQRNCCALFVGLNPNEVIQMGSTHERMTYEEWRKRRIDRARQALIHKE